MKWNRWVLLSSAATTIAVSLRVSLPVNPLCGALGDADLDGDVTDTYTGVISDAEHGVPRGW